MSRNLIIAAVAVVILLGAGYMILGNKKSAPSSSETAAPTTTESSVISSIKDALAGGQSLECKYADEDGRTTAAYIKNGMVRADVTASKPEEAGSVIIKDKKMYFWNAQGGFMMEMTDEMMEQGEEAAKESTQGQDTIANLEKYKESCKAGVIADSMFTPPANVKFQDMSSMIKNAMPSGTKAMPSGYDQKQVEEMMKQYSNPSQ